MSQKPWEQYWRRIRRRAGRIRRGVYALAFRAFERLLPVRDDYWLFCTWENYGHTLDNPRGVFEALHGDSTIKRIVLLKTAMTPPTDEGPSVVFVYAESIRGAYYLARSRVVLIGYALIAISSYSRYLRGSRHHVIQLNHGLSALKKFGLFDGMRQDWTLETRHYSAVTCSSVAEGELRKRAFDPVPRYWVTGQPRNDFILARSADLPSDYRAFRASFDERIAGRRVVLYAPTWRLEFSKPYIFSVEEVARLTALLSRHGALLAIHGHPNADWRSLFQEIPASEAILSVRDIPDINIILAAVDVLVTDYSSVFWDFLLLDKPIVHFAYDLELHRAHNRFFEDPATVFAGPSAETFDELMAALERALTNPDADAKRRSALLARFHQHGFNSGSQVVERVRALVQAT